MVEWRESTSEHPHQLWLRFADKAVTKLLEFGRHVDVLWAPDGSTIAITDHQGSTDSVLWIARVDLSSAAMNIEEAFIRTFGKHHAVYAHGHRYFTARSWSSARRLVFEVRGHDDLPDVQYRGTFVYELGGRIRESR